MKIYVTNIPPSTLNLSRLERYLINKDGTKKYELVSEEFGMHIIEFGKNANENENKNANMYRIEPTLNMDLHLIDNYSGFNMHKVRPVLLVDKTTYVHIPVVSQFPVDYILTKMVCFDYKMTKSGLKMTVECLLETNEYLEKEYKPINFYFTNSNSCLNIDDNLLEEINMFLLELY